MHPTFATRRSARAAILIILGCLTLDFARAEGPYTLTIYVDEQVPYGHVFVGVSDGVRTEKWGWYTQGNTYLQQLPGLLACAGGEVRRDDNRSFTISKTWTISRQAYFVAKSRVVSQAAGGEYGTLRWSPATHCGSFARDIAEAAGVRIEKPAYAPDTPHFFANYLRSVGGIANQLGPIGVPAPRMDLAPMDERQNVR